MYINGATFLHIVLQVTETARHERREVWKSLPDLSSSPSSSAPSSEHSDNEEGKGTVRHRNRRNQTVYESGEQERKETSSSYQNPSFDPRQFYKAEDDAMVCSLVPIKDRKIVFEQLEKEENGLEEKSRGGWLLQLFSV